MLIPKMTNFEEAGIFAVAVSIASILNQISTYPHQYQIADRYHSFTESDFAVNRLILIGLSLVSIVPISLLFGYDLEQISVIYAYVAYRSIINYAFLHMASLQIIDHLDYSGKCMMVEGIVSFTVFVSTYSLLGNLFVSILLMALTGGTLYLVMMERGYRKYYGHRYPRNIENSGNIRRLFKVTFPLIFSTLIPIIITALPKLLLEYFCDSEIAGIFNTIASPTSLIPTLVISVFTPFIVYFAKLCEENRMHDLRIQFTKMLGGIIVAGVLALIISIILADPVFNILYEDSISEYVPLFHILVIGVILYSIGTCGITVLIAKGDRTHAGEVPLVTLFISLVIFLIWIPAQGIDGATWGLLVSYGLFALISILCVYIAPIKNNESDCSDK